MQLNHLKSILTYSILLVSIYTPLLFPGERDSVSSIQGGLSSLSFISGNWQGEMNGSLIEEVWSLPSGDNMMGMFRLVSEEKAVFYEFMLIEQDTNGLVLRIKHFNPGLSGWEEKDEAHHFTLTQLHEKKAVFEERISTKRLIYHRFTADSLSIILDEPKDGQSQKIEFRLKYSGVLD